MVFKNVKFITKSKFTKLYNKSIGIICFKLNYLLSLFLATVLNSTEITDELIKNPRYLVVEREDGLFEVEDLEVKEINPALFAGENDVSFIIYTPENANGNPIF